MAISAGLEIGTRALSAHMRALDVVAHNVANANTEGYSRQEVKMSAGQPVLVPTNNKLKPLVAMGTGVKVDSVKRIRNEFLDEQVRDELSELGQWEAKKESYEIVEIAFGEPSEQSLGSVFDRFWNSIHSLAAPDPSDSGLRTQVVSEATLLSDSFNRIDNQLFELQKSLNQDIKLFVNEVNQLIDQISSINSAIVATEAVADANDLNDERTMLVTELNKLIKVNAVVNERGSMTVALGGSVLVSDKTSEHIDLKARTDGSGFYDVVLGESKMPAAIENGKLKGLLDSRDVIIKSYMDEIDTMAGALITSFNAIHQSGYDSYGTAGRDFFKGSDAGDIRVSDELIYDGGKFAASSSKTGLDGNGQNALDMARLRESKTVSNNSLSLEDFYQNVVSTLGIKTQESSNIVDTQSALVRHIKTKIESVSGVSLDEEMSEMLKIQHAYTAAAKYVQTINEILDVLMNLVR
jgi:flagellar hook-associated protein 1